jgi:acyl-CoA reductase-like NAD-dependent aldehyde dehydrogenase
MRTTDAREETATVTRTVASIIGGRTLEDAPGGRANSTNPARTGEMVAEVLLGDVGTFVEACWTAHDAQAEWAAVPAPIRAQAVKKI